MARTSQAQLALSLFILPVLLLEPGQAHARRYPITVGDSSGTWIGTPRGLLNGKGELLERYGTGKGLPADLITDLELNTRSVWVGTPSGLARMDKGTRRWETFGPPQLPSAHITAISVDPSSKDLVWIGTTRGLVKYDIRTNTWRKVTGAPAAKINDLLFRGKTVWVATDRGLSAYDTKLQTWTTFTSKDGLVGDRVLEIDEQGQDLWLSCEGGVTRMSFQRRTFFPLGKKEGMPGTAVVSMARLQNLIYFVTDGGLITYDTSADTLVPFLHIKGLQGAKVTSVVAAGGFLWFASEQGISRFDPTKKVWERYNVEDGMSNDAVDEITTAGTLLMIFGAGGELDTYNYKKDEWMERSSLLATAAAASQPGDSAAGSQPATAAGSQPAGAQAPRELKLSVSAELDTEIKQDLRSDDKEGFSREGYWLVNTLRLGTGVQWASGRTLDFSGSLDWGDISPVFEGEGATLKSFQLYDLQLRYLGLQGDLLREAILYDKLRLEPDKGFLVGPTELEGGRVVLSAGPRRKVGRLLTLEPSAGIRRGTPMRVVLRRPSVGEMQIKRFKLLKQMADGTTRDVRYVIPQSVRALIDGQELERNVDYFMDHENGVLWLKNTDLLNALQVMEVEFEYEQIPRKNVGAVSMTDLLPKDGVIGNIKRSGGSRWAKDEQGLFDEIDGGAEQYINRGWAATLSQDFEWGSSSIILRIHDMGDDQNAQAILLARKLPDAKAVPGLEEVFIEKQAASLSIKMVRDQYFIEISIDQASMEHEIISISGWIVGKLAASGSTTADAFRDAVISAMATLAVTDHMRIGFGYLGTRSIKDSAVKEKYDSVEELRDLFAMNAEYSRRLTRNMKLAADMQLAVSSYARDGGSRIAGNGLQGRAHLTSPRLVLRVAGRRYSQEYSGIGVARQTEFCRSPDGRCDRPGTSRMDYEVGSDATVRPVTWLPVKLFWQRQATRLGDDYKDAPVERAREGVRDIAMARVSLDHQKLPKVSLGGGYIGRDDALAEQGQLRGTGSVEVDLAQGWLKSLKMKKIFLRGLYEYGRNEVDEFRVNTQLEQDRVETINHAVGEIRVAPTLTENAYATLEFQDLRGALTLDKRVIDRMTYWRLDSGAGSSIVPGLALRFESTLWVGDDQPRGELDATSTLVDRERSQEANATLSGIMDIFPGEWFSKLSELKFNAAFTYARQAQAQGMYRVEQTGLPDREQCQNGVDDDGDGRVDCDDPQCAMEDACLLRTGLLVSNRAYGTLYWDTPGKLQAEIFADIRWSYSDKDKILRSFRQEFRSYVTWRPIHSSPITLRFDLQRDQKRPSQYDGVTDTVEPNSTILEPALEWRRRWSPKWWHLAKVTVSHASTRDLPHVRTVEDSFGRKGDLERLDYNELSLKPSLEVRRTFEDEAGNWNFRPYMRASYKLQWGSGIRSRIDDQVRELGEPGLADGSETSRTLSVSLGLVWVHSENILVDLDLNTSYYDCDRAPTGSVCNDAVTFTPHLLATARF